MKYFPLIVLLTFLAISTFSQADDSTIHTPLRNGAPHLALLMGYNGWMNNYGEPGIAKKNNFTSYFIRKDQLIVFNVEQGDNEKLIDSLKYVTDMPYICESEGIAGCGDRFFWNVVKRKQSIVPLLIDALTDTTTTPAHVPNLGGQWTVADIAYHALTEIVQGIPTFELLGVPFDNEGCGFCSYWKHLRSDSANRIKFQTNVREWYDQNKTQLVWVESNEFQTCDCRGAHPNGGHFEVRTN